MSRFAPSVLDIRSPSRRKSLFSSPGDENIAPRPLSSTLSLSSATETKLASPSLGTGTGTRIPRPLSAPQQRPPLADRPKFSLSDAYKMAEAEEEEAAAAAEGSPSPAPRAWRDRRDSGSRKQPKLFARASAESQHLKTVRTRNSADSSPSGDTVSSLGSRPSNASDSDFDEKIRQHALSQAASIPDSPHRSGGSGRFSRSRLGTKVAEMGKGLVRKTSRSSLDGHSPKASRTTTATGWLSRRLSGKKSWSSNGSLNQPPADWEHAAQPDAEEPPDSPGGLARPAIVPPGSNPSPNKSFPWEADADFTAGDLQFSNSPPVVTGRTNTRINEIRALEAEVEKHPIVETVEPRPRNSRLDQIRALEIEAALKYTSEPPEPPEPPEPQVVEDAAFPSAQPAGQTDSRIDRLRAREIESLSRRALATTRLDEIRSRSSSPEIIRNPSKEVLRALSPDGARLQGSERGGKPVGEESQRVPIDEVMSAGASVNNGDPTTKDDKAEGGQNKSDVSEPNPKSANPGPQARDDSRDLLRRLALATTSPSPEPPPVKGDSESATRGREGRDETRQRKSDVAKGDARPSVGFVGLRRGSSVSSSSDKRSNLALSDSDPTDRIEGEMKLFAPAENHSERGSLRAPSPDPNEGATNETPRPGRPDPLAQPTPRVTGAFVETPATVKVEKPQQPSADLVAVAKAPQSNGTKAGAPNGTKVTTEGSGKSAAISSAKGARGEGPLARTSSVSTRRRARSLSRTRSPLINSARPPTVKDDLLEIQRYHHLEDSTLDDFADLLDGQQTNGQAVFDPYHAKSEQGADALSDSKKELDTYDRMNKALKTGLMGIRTAKQGIERLEDKVSHGDAKPLSRAHGHTHDETTPAAACPVCHGQPAHGNTSLTYVHLPMPRLWRRRPDFKFTWLGLLLFLGSLWYIAESTMCSLYCRPLVCYPGQPCDWSPDDPRWGYAIPVKLDQWATGGQGRAYARQVAPDVADWVADVWDVATGTDITQVDTKHYSWEQKHQHRRRLLKKGLARPFVARSEDKEKLEEWKAAKLAREAAEAAREMGYSVGGEEESMAVDETLVAEHDRASWW
ncbi:hypothetical protein B0T19DRAFT_366208 [Cercophora scortea]|uniref:Uncharacterized protein n=1 Tax=Cercophora scortea TaxID=314031 RepID=A0AAE0J694_9PEZI|nr:hypothetical protein B0T19DRAFT_366208 [Cercophora scortea]